MNRWRTAAAATARNDVFTYSQARRGRADIVMRDGNIIAERYHNGAAPGAAWPVYSCSKSFTAVLAAKLVEMGLLTWDTLVCTIITEWAGDPFKSLITIGDLMRQRSGMQAIAFQQLTYQEVIALPATAKAWDYDNVHWLVLAEVIRRIVTAPPHNKASPSHALVDWVLTPAGITVASWDQLSVGVTQPNMASGVNIRPREFAKFCEFLRIGGGGIIKEQYLGDLIEQSPYWAYGMGFWGTCDRITAIIQGNADPAKTIPFGGYAAIGRGFCFGYVLPDKNAVIIRVGDLAQVGDTPFIEQDYLNLALKVLN